MIRVYTSGVFDLFHVGHLSLLQKAKDLGDYLIVGVHSDEVVAGYKREPVIPLEQRMDIVRNIKCVDEVIVAPLTRDLSEDFYREHGISIHCAGDNMQEYYQLPQRLGIMRYVARCPVTDTTRIIKCVYERDEKDMLG